MKTRETPLKRLSNLNPATYVVNIFKEIIKFKNV
jgi:hypothetical protein